MREIETDRDLYYVINMWIFLILLFLLTVFSVISNNTFLPSNIVSNVVVTISIMKLTPLTYKGLILIVNSIENMFIFKAGVIFIFVLVSFFMPFIDSLKINSNEWYGIDFGYWTIGWMISLVMAYLTHLLVYKIILNKYIWDTGVMKKEYYSIKSAKKNFVLSSFWHYLKDTEGSVKIGKKIEHCMNILFRLLTPDYSYAVNFKVLLMNDNLTNNYLLHTDEISDTNSEKLANRKKFEKVNRKLFIEYSNWLNIALSCFYVFIGLLSVKINVGKELFFCFIVFKIFSRTFEIIVAFYKDVVRTKKGSPNKIYKSSSLLKGNRISLAVHSYLEVVILFSVFYYLISHIQMFGEVIISEGFYLDYLLHSFSIASFTAITTPNLTILAIFYTLQIFTSITLVVLSIATYIGLKDEDLE